MCIHLGVWLTNKFQVNNIQLSGDVCPGFQSRAGLGIRCTQATKHGSEGRFTCGVTPANNFAASMVAKPFRPHTCTGGAQVQDQVCHCLTACDKTNPVYRLS